MEVLWHQKPGGSCCRFAKGGRSLVVKEEALKEKAWRVKSVGPIATYGKLTEHISMCLVYLCDFSL